MYHIVLRWVANNRDAASKTMASLTARHQSVKMEALPDGEIAITVIDDYSNCSWTEQQILWDIARHCSFGSVPHAIEIYPLD